MINRWTRTSK